MDDPASTRTEPHRLVQPGANRCRSVRGQKYAALVLNALNDTGRESAASFLKVDKSTVTRLANEHLDKLCDLLVHLNLKVVPQEMQCYKPESIAALMQLAKERMDQLETPEQLVWDE